MSEKRGSDVFLLEELDCEYSNNEAAKKVNRNAKGDASTAKRITDYTILFQQRKTIPLKNH
jgi:hypothetical protein